MKPNYEHRTHYELLRMKGDDTRSIASFGHRNDAGVIKAAEKLIRDAPNFEYDLVVVTADGDTPRSVKTYSRTTIDKMLRAR
jgi:hypothetical protein